MKVHQGKFHYVWKMNINGMVRYGVSRNLAVGTLYVTADMNDAIEFLKEIEEE